jgi:serine O-acetyltransferase
MVTEEQVSATSRSRILRFQRRLRRLEHLSGSQGGILRKLRLAVLWRVHNRQAAMLGFTIPLNTFGPGLCIAHYGTIAVNDFARIGASCRIHPNTTIGRTDAGTPVIGDNAYVGPGAESSET